ncbi:MAG: RCC1 domain-containing protein [Polyangiales bacterium]
MAPSPAPLAASPYRAPIALHPGRRPTRPPPWRAALLLSALVAGAVSTPKARIRRATGDDPAPGAAVEHAGLLAGGEKLCALTAMRDGTHQVVCAEVDEVTEGIDRRRVPHAWRSPALTQLVSCGDGDTVALGLTAEGRVVRFARGSTEARPWTPPALAPHGPITALSCDSGFGSSRTLFASTRDGAVLRLDPSHDVAAPASAWTELFPAAPGGARLIPRLQENPCAVRADGVWCAPFDTVGDRVPAERALEGTAWTEATYGAPWLCARDRAGHVECAYRQTLDDVAVWVHSPLEGAPLHAEAVVGSMGDLCVRGSASRWWCAAGPSRDAPLPLLYEARLAVHPEPLLDGAAEVALGEGSGCARWPDGDVRCWGRHLRGGSFDVRGPVEIPAARDASAVSADGSGACALRRGEVWCWGSLGSARPQRVELPGDAQALDAPYAAVGATVYRIQHGGRATALPAPRGDDAPVESIAHGWNSLCARRADGRVTCWRAEEGGDDDGPPTVRYVPERVAALEGRARFTGLYDSVCAWDPGRAGRCWGREVVAPTGAIAYGRWRVRDVPAHQFDAPTRLDGRCAVYPGGHRDCYEGDTLADLLGIPPPDWALDPEGDFARLRRRDDARCDLLPDRRVACRVDHVVTTSRAPHDEYALPYWRVMPGLRDVRTVSATPRYDPLGYGDWFGCAIREDGRVFCWGTNLDDALTVGDSDRAPPLVPLRR